MRKGVCFVMIVLLGAVLCGVMPSGMWFTFGGGFRWEWGVPFEVAEVQGVTPYQGEVGIEWLGFLKNLGFSVALFGVVYFACYVWPQFRLRVSLVTLLILYLLLHIFIFHRMAKSALLIQRSEQEIRLNLTQDREKRGGKEVNEEKQ